jgi:hypothetical protein
MAPIPIDSRKLKNLIDKGQDYQWVLGGHVSGHLKHDEAHGFYIPCGEEPGEEPSRVRHGDVLEHINNGRKSVFRYTGD